MSDKRESGLIKNAGDDPEGKIFYLKMKGDYLRYKAEVAQGKEKQGVCFILCISSCSVLVTSSEFTGVRFLTKVLCCSVDSWYL